MSGVFVHRTMPHQEHRQVQASPKALAARSTDSWTSQHTSFPVRREVALHLYVAEEVSSKAGVTSVHHHSVQGVEEGLSIGVRHVWPEIQALRILHNLWRNQDGSEMILSYHMKQPSTCHGLGGRKLLCQGSSAREVSCPWEGTRKAQHKQLVTEPWGIFCSKEEAALWLHTHLAELPAGPIIRPSQAH